jgi:hypothetical protein
MVGLMQIMIYMLAVYLVYKGGEILQIALMSSRQDRTLGITIGFFSLVVAVVLGVAFTLWAHSVAQSIGERKNNIPGLPR